MKPSNITQQEDNVMDNKFIPSDDIKAKIEDIAKNRSNYEPLSAKELDEVSGGIDGDDVVNVDNIRINGWSYKELYNILCWTYESYYIPGESWDYAKGLTVDVAESFIPSVRWKQCMYLPYPQFIQEAMRRIWLKIPT
jgi:hypothetical protein